MRRLAVCWLLVAAGCAAEDGEPHSDLIVEASVDRRTLLIGEPLSYALAVKYRPGGEVILPVFAKRLGTMEVVRRVVVGPRRDGASTRLEHVYTLRTLTPGRHVLGPVLVEYRSGNARAVQEARRIQVEVAGVYREGDPLRDLKDLPPEEERHGAGRSERSRPAGPGAPFWIASSLLAALGVLAVIARVRGARRAVRESAPEVEEPHDPVRIIRALEELARGRDVDAFLAEAQRATRIILTGGEADPGLLGEEILADSDLPREDREVLEVFLDRADRVRFGRRRIRGEDLVKWFKRLRTVLEKAASRRAERAGPEPPANASC